MTGDALPRVYWNGDLVPAEEAAVSVFDAGFLYGDGIYETLRAYGGRTFRLDRHLERLACSAERVALALPPRDELRAAVAAVIAANGVGDCVVRMTVTRGLLARRLDLSSSGRPSVLVTAYPVSPAEDERRRHGVRVIFSHYLRLSDDPLAGVKSTNYQISLFARNEAREAGADEVLIPNESGGIVEAAAANVFFVRGDRVCTPPLRSGILGGITRETVCELVTQRGLELGDCTLSREELPHVDELFLTATSIRIVPVVAVEDLTIGNGRPGPLTLALLEDYLAAVRADTGSAGPDGSSESNR